MKKRFLSLLLVLCLLVTCVPIASATGTTGFHCQPFEQDNDDKWVANGSSTTTLDLAWNASVQVAFYDGETLLTDTSTFTYDNVKVSAIKGETDYFKISITDPSNSGKITYNNADITVNSVAPKYAFYTKDNCSLAGFTEEEMLSSGANNFWFSVYDANKNIEFVLVDNEENDVGSDIASVSLGTASNGVLPVTVTINKMPADEIYLWAVSGEDTLAEVTLNPGTSDSNTGTTSANNLTFNSDLSATSGLEAKVINVPTTGRAMVQLFYNDGSNNQPLNGTHLGNLMIKGCEGEETDEWPLSISWETEDTPYHFEIVYKDVNDTNTYQLYYGNDEDSVLTIKPILPDYSFHDVEGVDDDGVEIPTIIEELEVQDLGGTKEFEVYCFGQTNDPSKVTIELDSKSDAGFKLTYSDPTSTTMAADKKTEGYLYTCTIEVDSSVTYGECKLNANDASGKTRGELEIAYYNVPAGLSVREAENNNGKWTAHDAYLSALEVEIGDETDVAIYLEGKLVTDPDELEAKGCKLEEIKKGFYTVSNPALEGGTITHEDGPELNITAVPPKTGFYASVDDTTIEIDEGTIVGTTRFGYELADQTGITYSKTFPVYFYLETEASSAPGLTFSGDKFTVTVGTAVQSGDGFLYPLTLTIANDSIDGFGDYVNAVYNNDTTNPIASGFVTHWYVKKGLTYRDLDSNNEPSQVYRDEEFINFNDQGSSLMAIGDTKTCAIYYNGALVTDIDLLSGTNATVTAIDASKGLYTVSPTGYNGRINFLDENGRAADYLEIGPQVEEDNSSSNNNSSGSSSSTPTTSVDTSKDTTTVTTKATVKGDTASANVSNAVGKELIEQANENDSTEVVIAPEIKDDDVTKTEVKIPSNTVGNIGEETDADLTISTPVADVTLPNESLSELAAEGGSVEIIAERDGNTVTVEIIANKETVESVPSGITVTVPMEDYTAGTVAVIVYEDGTREVVTKSVAVDGSMIIPLDGSATIELVDNSKDFADVSKDDWYADAIDFVSARGLFSGTGDGSFSPNMPMSRGMVAAVLYNLENNPDHSYTGSFTDVADGAWYTESALWAAEQGIVSGYTDGSFGVNDNVSREQFAVMLWRYAGCPAASGVMVDFADADQASEYAQEALNWAVGQGILSGKAGVYLDPQGEASRAEIAIMLKNFLENI